MSVHPLWVIFLCQIYGKVQYNSTKKTVVKLSFCVAVGVFIPNAHSATITVTLWKMKRKFQAEQARCLKMIQGIFQNLEVINSGSVFELDKNTVELIKKVCKQKNIHTIHFESHYLYNNRIADLRKEFSDFTLKMKLGLETFVMISERMYLKRESKKKILKKSLKILMKLISFLELKVRPLSL